MGRKPVEIPMKQRADSESSYMSEVSEHSFDSTLSKHGCTDILCSIIFIIFIVALAAVSVFSYYEGNPSNLILPHDSAGNNCGKSEGFENKKYLFFFDITRCASLTTALSGCPTKQICVDKCPESNSYEKIPSQLDEIRKYCDYDGSTCPAYILRSEPVFGRCIPTLIANIFTSSAAFVINTTDSSTNTTVAIQVPTANGMTDLTYESIKQSVRYLTEILNLKKFVEMAFEDLSKTSWFILVGLGLGAFVSFIWLFILRFIIKPMIYLTILSVLSLLGFGTYFTVIKYLNFKIEQPTQNLKFQIDKLYNIEYLSSQKETWLALAIVLGILFVVLFLIVIFIRKRIHLAAELIREVSKAIVLIPASLVWPVVPFLVEIGIIVYCLSVVLYLASAGTSLFKIVDTSLTNGTNITEKNFRSYAAFMSSEHRLDSRAFKPGDYCDRDVFYEWKSHNNNSELDTLECYFYRFGFDPNIKFEVDGKVKEYYTKTIEFINNYRWAPQLFVIFMLFWLSAFVIGLSEMTLAGSFGAWYWTRFKNVDSSYDNKLPFLTVLGSLGRALFYHMGTIAFGSLLIAIVKIIRLILEYLSKKLKPKVDVSSIAKYLVCCLKCCFWCLERFIKFLNRYAFIITAISSFNFCMAAKEAFRLIATNAVRVVVIDKITAFILFLSNVAITSLFGIFGYFVFTKQIPYEPLINMTPDLNYYFVPIVACVIGVFIITKLFFDVFSMGVDTLLICVLIDVESNDGTRAKPYFMSKSLQKLLKVSKTEKQVRKLKK